MHGNYYGTAKKTIEDAFARGKSVLLDIDVQGADSLQESLSRSHIFRSSSLRPSMEELEKRLRARGTDTEETIQKRTDRTRARKWTA